MPDSDKDPDAPKDLRKVFGALGGFKQRVREGKRKRILVNGSGGKQKEKFPTAICEVCSGGYEWSHLVTKELPKTDGQCPDCKRTLQEGHYAVVCPDGYAFIKADDTVKELSGKVVKVRPQVFEQIKKKYADKIKQVKNAAGNN